MSKTQTMPDLSPSPVEVPLHSPLPEVVPLDPVIESIKLDSLKNPETYLEETEVPDGGE